MSGTGRFLKSQNSDVRVVMADPRGSVFWDHFVKGVPEDEVKVSQGWETEGVGKDSIPGCLDIDVVDGMVRATDEHAFRTCREVAANDGLLIGGSAGLNLHATRVLSGEVEDGSVHRHRLPRLRRQVSHQDLQRRLDDGQGRGAHRTVRRRARRAPTCTGVPRSRPRMTEGGRRRGRVEAALRRRG